MKPEEIRQLLGGYASGTLSKAEQKLLFEAALEDQVLFDALADEQAFKDLLDDPESRGYLRAVLEEGPPRQHGLHVVMSAPAPVEMMRKSADAPGGRSPKMWWGLLAAAALATASVVGILKMTEKSAPMEMAKNVPAAVVTPEQPRAEPKPAAQPAMSAPRVAEMKTAGKVSLPAGPVAERQKEERAADKRTEVQKPREEVAVAPVVATPPPASVPVQLQQGPPPSAPVTQSQVRLDQARPSSMPGARQLYFAGEEAANKTAASEGVSFRANAESAPEAMKDAKEKKAVAASAAGEMGRATPESLALRRAAPAKLGFAMRYQIFVRRHGQNFAAVPPGNRFTVGDEVVLVIEKNSGGTALIERVADGTATAVAMVIQTNKLARSVPVMVTGSMELALVLNRDGLAKGLIPAQPAAQTTEVADGMVYVAEPAAAGMGQVLVVRVPIRVE